MEPSESAKDLLQLRQFQNACLVVTFKTFCTTIKTIGKSPLSTDKTVCAFFNQIKVEWETFLQVSQKSKYWDRSDTVQPNDVVHSDASEFLHGCIGLLCINDKVMRYISEKCPAWPWLIANIDKRLAQENQIIDYLIHPQVTQHAPISMHGRAQDDLRGLLSELRNGDRASSQKNEIRKAGNSLPQIEANEASRHEHKKRAQKNTGNKT